MQALRWQRSLRGPSSIPFAGEEMEHVVVIPAVIFLDGHIVLIDAAIGLAGMPAVGEYFRAVRPAPVSFVPLVGGADPDVVGLAATKLIERSDDRLHFRVWKVPAHPSAAALRRLPGHLLLEYAVVMALQLSLIHISEPTRQAEISYA